jgi:hypothetical protein
VQSIIDELPKEKDHRELKKSETDTRGGIMRLGWASLGSELLRNDLRSRSRHFPPRLIRKLIRIVDERWETIISLFPLCS